MNEPMRKARERVRAKLGVACLILFGSMWLPDIGIRYLGKWMTLPLLMLVWGLLLKYIVIQARIMKSTTNSA